MSTRIGPLAPGLAGILHCPQHRVDRGEPTIDPLARDRLAGDDAVTFEQSYYKWLERAWMGVGLQDVTPQLAEQIAHLMG